MFEGGITGLIVNDYDDPMIHMKEHDHFRKSRDYQNFREVKGRRKNDHCYYA